MAKRRSSGDDNIIAIKKFRSPGSSDLPTHASTQPAGPSKRSRHLEDSSRSSDAEFHKRLCISDNSQSNVSSASNNANPGKLIKIVLKNFMCHEHLIVTFNDKINFVCGKNGSGKSAILTGIVVGLGGRASVANRGDLKNVILSGSQSASIEITLSNVGEHAFKPNEYGEEITIHRTLTESGDNKVSSSFKMLSKTGKVVSSLKGELNKMLAAFNLKIDNPVAILNQDMARNFLKNCKPADLYKFLSWSTGFLFIEKALIENNSTADKLERDLDTKSKELEFSSRDLLEIKRKHELKNEYDDICEKIAILQNELNWSQVHELKEENEKKRKTAERLKEYISELKKKFENKDEIESEVLAKKSALEEELAAVSEDYSKNVQEQALADNEYSAKRSELEKLSIRRKKIEYQLAEDEESLKRLMDQLNNLSSLNSETAAKRDAMAKEKTKLEQMLQEFKNVLVVNETHKKNLVEDKNKKMESVRTAEQNLNHIVQQKNATARTINSLKSKNDALNMYGDWMPALVNKIKTAASMGAFSATPVGPLGQYIKLQDPRFGPVIEKFLGASTFTSFCCSTERDAVSLRKLFRDLNIRNPPTIITSKFLDKVHDVRKYETRHGQYGSLFSALEFSNPVVANCLIDQREIENILLVPSDRETFPLVEVKENVPVNCKRVLSPENLYFPAPNYRSYAIEVAKSASFLHQDKEQQIKEKMLELKELQQSEIELRREVDKAQAELRDANQREQDWARKSQKIKSNHQQIDQKLFMLKNQEEPMEINEIFLTEDIEFKKDKMKKSQDELQVVKEQSADIVKKVKEADSVRAALKSKTKNHNTKVSNIKMKILEVTNECRELSGNFKKFKKKSEEEEKKLSVLEKMISELCSKIEAKEQEAYNSGNNPTDFRDVRTVEQELSEKNSYASEIKAILGDGDLEQLSEEYMRRLQQLTDCKQLLMLTKISVQDWKKSNDKLHHKFMRTRNIVSHNVTHHMQVYLKLRNYKCNLQIDHSNKKVEITVQMSTEQNVREQSAICMSGGERSYSMVAFILALWQETKVPFYCLDEFDVFMDPVNRKLVINLLVAHARNWPNHQFIFLTPNDFHTKLDKDIGIFRLIDPRQDAA